MQVVAAAFVITACGSIRGHPSVFSDTAAYVRQGEYLAIRLHLGEPLAEAPGTDRPAALSRAAIAKAGPDYTTMAAARSPFYGFWLFVLAGIGSIWLVAFAQALVAAWLLRVAAATAVPDGTDAAFWTTVVVLGIGSSLPFFVDFAMPDVFAGFALIAVALLLAAPDRLRRRDLCGLWVTMTTAMLFHRSIEATVLCLTLVSLVGLARRGASLATVIARGAVIAGGGAVAVLAAGASQLAYHSDTGYFMGTPPFLAARVLIDGPGKAYLDAFCPGGVAPTFCRYKNASMNDEDEVLWRMHGGVFGSAPYGDRVAMEKEELAFVAASIRFAPALAFTSAARNWAEQLALMFVDDPLGDPAGFLAHPGSDVPAIQHLYQGLAPCRIRGGCLAVSVPMFIRIVLAVEAPVFLVSLYILVFVGVASLRPLARGGGAGDDHMRMVVSAGRLIVYGIILNAAVCGILSGPFPRYQARVIWLVPMIAVLGLLALRRYGGARSTVQRAIGGPHAASVLAGPNQ